MRTWLVDRNGVLVQEQDSPAVEHITLTYVDVRRDPRHFDRELVIWPKAKEPNDDKQPELVIFREAAK